MRLALFPLLLVTYAADVTRAALPTAIPNANTISGGRLERGIFRISLDATHAIWHPDGDSLPGIPVEVFAEPGKAPLAPGPLIRVPVGTRIEVTVRNRLPADTLTFILPSADSMVLAPGAAETVTTSLGAGTWLYRAWASNPIGRVLGVTGVLAGAIVVDSAGGPRPDRVFVITSVTDSLDSNNFSLPPRTVFSINGRTWPHTERLELGVGDSAQWRMVNATHETHPMHLHGFYFRVNSVRGSRLGEGQDQIPRMAVTERMSAFSTMDLTWVPERAGNWLFHCHFQVHVMPHGKLDSVWPTRTRPRIANAGPAHEHVRGNHALTGMAGLVLGIRVRSTGASPVPAINARSIRLFAVEDGGFPDGEPSMRYTLEPGTARVAASPTLSVTRGEPVAITVINRMRRPTSVHWHGIELESYYDGVAGFSGSGASLSPVIEPGDSFVARFTPPRAGTFIYHSHIDEVVQHRAGLVGALIVRAPGEDTTRERIWLLKATRERESQVPIEINASAEPDTAVLEAGRRYRFRLINMTTGNPGATFWLTARPDSQPFRPHNDSLGLRWLPLAKDGADIPDSRRIPRPAGQNVSIGETYDFEFMPAARGNIRLEVWGDIGRRRLLNRIPIRIE